MSLSQWFLVAAFCAAFLFSDFDYKSNHLPDSKPMVMVAGTGKTL